MNEEIGSPEYTPEAIAARTRLEIWREILRHGGTDAEKAIETARKVWMDLGFPAGGVDCWAVMDGSLIVQNYASEHIAREHAFRESKLRVVRLREVS